MDVSIFMNPIRKLVLVYTVTETFRYPAFKATVSHTINHKPKAADHVLSDGFSYARRDFRPSVVCAERDDEDNTTP